MGGFFFARKEADMVTVEYIVRSALRRDTPVSRAFLRACGIPVPRPPQAGCVASVAAADDVLWCLANHGSPMDGRR